MTKLVDFRVIPIAIMTKLQVLNNWTALHQTESQREEDGSRVALAALRLKRQTEQNSTRLLTSNRVHAGVNPPRYQPKLFLSKMQYYMYRANQRRY